MEFLKGSVEGQEDGRDSQFPDPTVDHLAILGSCIHNQHLCIDPVVHGFRMSEGELVNVLIYYIAGSEMKDCCLDDLQGKNKKDAEYTPIFNRHG